MKPSNNYISLERALKLQEEGWIFKQNPDQSKPRIMRGENSLDWYYLNPKTATQFKKILNQRKNQTKLL